MRFVIDAQLPPRLTSLIESLGHEAVQVVALAGGPSQPDSEVAATADAEGRVVVTKDSDFRHSHAVSASPAKLLLIATSNIRNDELFGLIEARLNDIVAAFRASTFVELHRDVLVIHGGDWFEASE